MRLLLRLDKAFQLDDTASPDKLLARDGRTQCRNSARLVTVEKRWPLRKTETNYDNGFPPDLYLGDCAFRHRRTVAGRPFAVAPGPFDRCGVRSWQLSTVLAERNTTMALFGYDWSIRNNVSAICAHIVAKNEARNRVAAYRKTLTVRARDKKAVEAWLSILEPTLVLVLSNPPGSQEHAGYSRNVEIAMKRIDDYSHEAKQEADYAARKAENAK
jgi:hypothetical protein